jgi:hypothetical protein
MSSPKRNRIQRQPIFIGCLILMILASLIGCTNEPQTISQAVSPTAELITTPQPVKTYLAELETAEIPRVGYGELGIGVYPFDDPPIKKGSPLFTHGKLYEHALFAHAASTLVYNLDGDYDTFFTTILISDMLKSGCGDGALFRIDLDGETAYLSPILVYNSQPIDLEIDVKGVKYLRLETYTDTNYIVNPGDVVCDWTIWGDPYLISAPKVAEQGQSQVLSNTPTVMVPQLPEDPIAEFYISPFGSDDNPGTREEPFNTIEHAKLVIRSINQNMAGPIYVYLREGVYQIEDTIVFSQEDSGTNGQYIVYQAFPGETPTLSGGITIKGSMTPLDGKPYYSLELPSEIETFRNLYINGRRAVRAVSEQPIIGSGWWSGDWSDQDGIVISASSLPAFSHAEDLEAHWILDWVDARHRVENIQSLRNGQSVIKMKEPYFLWGIAHDITYTDTKWRPRWDAPFYLENAIELLDQPGEWFFDKRTHMLYYYPLENENPNNLEIVVPQLETLVEIQGDLDNRVHNLRFSGLTFAYSTWMRASIYGVRSELDQPTDGFEGGVGFSPAVLELSNSEAIDLYKNKFIHTGSSAINIVNNNKDVELSGNLIQDVSKNAVVIGWPIEWLGEEALLKLPPMSNQGISITNNLINNIGIEYWGSPGIDYFFGTEINIMHNNILNVANNGIGLSGAVSGCDRGCPDSRVINVSYNRIENTSLRGEYPYPYNFESTSLGGDAGGIYTNNTVPKLTINNNYIKNVVNHYSCIYLDGSSVGVEIFQNVCDSAPSWIYFHSNQPASNNDSSQVQDITADDNYSNVPAYFNGMNAVIYTETNPYLSSAYKVSITNTHYLPNSNWPEEAQVVIDEAGLEVEYRYLLSELIP